MSISYTRFIRKIGNWLRKDTSKKAFADDKDPEMRRKIPRDCFHERKLNHLGRAEHWPGCRPPMIPPMLKENPERYREIGEELEEALKWIVPEITGRKACHENLSQMRHEDKLREKIREAKHQSKSDEASLVVHDKDGRWLFEVYGEIDASQRERQCKGEGY